MEKGPEQRQVERKTKMKPQQKLTRSYISNIRKHFWRSHRIASRRQANDAYQCTWKSNMTKNDDKKSSIQKEYPHHIEDTDQGNSKETNRNKKARHPDKF